MKFVTSDKINFWNKKILTWENARYGNDFSVEENAANSIQSRIKLTVDLIKRANRKFKILELGCGSGLLARQLPSSCVERYLGIDFSSEAIDKARSRPNGTLDKKAVDFQCADVREFSSESFDLVVSLGLLDWLSDEEVLKLLTNNESEFFIHSYSSDDKSIQQRLHKIMVYFQYGRKTFDYIPLYRADDLMRTWFRSSKPQIINQSSLGFGRLVHNMNATL